MATVTDDVDDFITASEAAVLAGCQPETFRSYERRGYAPARARTFGTTPVWSRKAILAWLESRPGTGARTDLRKREAGGE